MAEQPAEAPALAGREIEASLEEKTKEEKNVEKAIEEARHRAGFTAPACFHPYMTEEVRCRENGAGVPPGRIARGKAPSLVVSSASV
jgi:hypothetical protein